MKGFNALNQTNQEVQAMLRIALCDDDFIQELHQKLIQWYQESDNSRNISVSEFSDSSYLARTIDSGSSFDLLFVDIEMPKMNGLKLAEHVRTRLPMAMIIFLTVRQYSDMTPNPLSGDCLCPPCTPCFRNHHAQFGNHQGQQR